MATAVRLLLGAVVPLFPDEAYYWEWSRNLATGYFDHPPVIAALIRLGTLVFGNSEIGVRVVPILAATGCGVAIIRTARALGGDGAARLAAVCFTVMPIAAAGSVLATPDAPMLCAMAWCMYAVVRALGMPECSWHEATPTPRETLRWWVIAGACAGVAMASKYTSVLLPAGIAAAFVMHGKLQNRFGERGPYVAVLVASAVLLPVLWWNATHDWVSFRFQLSHGLGAPRGGAIGALNRELELVGGQIGLVSPILFYFMIRAVRDAVRFSEEGIRFALGAACVVPLLFFVYSATRRSVEANWPAMAWIAAIPLLASDVPHTTRMRAWLGRGLVLAAALSAMVYVHVLVPILPLRPDRDQVAKAFGWELVAATLERKMGAVRQRAGNESLPVFVAAERYQDAAKLAFALADHPRTYSLNLTGRANQYDLWPLLADQAPLGSTVLLVLDDARDEPRAIRKLSCCFSRIDESEGVALMRGGDVVARKRIWILSGKNDGWPTRDQAVPGR
jgi:4-amino-4-deoxy-L-arabinose transferase-like glycosyltransferase